MISYRVTVGVPHLLGLGTIEFEPATHWKRHKDGSLTILCGQDEVGYLLAGQWLRVKR